MDKANKGKVEGINKKKALMTGIATLGIGTSIVLGSVAVSDNPNVQPIVKTNNFKKELGPEIDATLDYTDDRISILDKKISKEIQTQTHSVLDYIDDLDDQNTKSIEEVNKNMVGLQNELKNDIKTADNNLKSNLEDQIDNLKYDINEAQKTTDFNVEILQSDVVNLKDEVSTLKREINIETAAGLSYTDDLTDDLDIKLTGEINTLKSNLDEYKINTDKKINIKTNEIIEYLEGNQDYSIREIDKLKIENQGLKDEIKHVKKLVETRAMVNGKLILNLEKKLDNSIIDSNAELTNMMEKFDGSLEDKLTGEINTLKEGVKVLKTVIKNEFLASLGYADGLVGDLDDKLTSFIDHVDGDVLYYVDNQNNILKEKLGNLKSKLKNTNKLLQKTRNSQLELGLSIRGVYEKFKLLKNIEQTQNDQPIVSEKAAYLIKEFGGTPDDIKEAKKIDNDPTINGIGDKVDNGLQQDQPIINNDNGGLKKDVLNNSLNIDGLKADFNKKLKLIADIMSEHLTNLKKEVVLNNNNIVKNKDNVLKTATGMIEQVEFDTNDKLNKLTDYIDGELLDYIIDQANISKEDLENQIKKLHVKKIEKEVNSLSDTLSYKLNKVVENVNHYQKQIVNLQKQIVNLEDTVYSLKQKVNDLGGEE